MLVELVKLAYSLDAKKEYDMARAIDEMIAELMQRTGLDQKNMLALANYFDEQGEIVLADKLDALLSEAKKKKHEHKSKGDKKAPEGAMHKAPKAWFDEELKKVMKGNPGYSKERASKVVGDLWDNKLSDAKRSKIYKEHGKHKNPNK